MKDYTHNLLPERPTQRGRGNGPIFLIVFAAVAWIALGTLAVFADTKDWSNSNSESEASAEVRVNTGAAAGINNYGQRPGEENRTYQEVATAPSLGGLALGGGHPCAYSPATAQISIIGGGFGAGGMKVDSACMLMVMGAAGDAQAYKASQYMLAARDPLACAAMESAGMIGVGSCEKPSRRNWARPTVATAGAETGTGAKCVMEGRKITFRATSAGAQAAELSACKASFGL